LSFEGPDPESVQKVTNELAQMYVDEEHKNKKKIVAVTTDFLSAELEKFKALINQYENEISEYKRANVGALPENYLSNIQKLDRLERELDRSEINLRALQAKKVFLKTQLSNVEPWRPVMVDGENMMLSPIERLKRLRLQLVSAGTTLSEKHPDIKRLKREIAELEASVGDSDDVTAKVFKLQELEGKLAELRGKWGDKHPDVQKLSRTVAALSREVAASQAPKIELKNPNLKPDNPTYINLTTQLAEIEVDINAAREDQNKIKDDIEKYEELIDKAPLVEKKYNELTRDYMNTKDKYSELSHKLMSAKVSKGMEEAQRGENFTIADPAHFPEKPSKPNRVMIVVFGFIIAFGAAVGLGTIRESMDNTIKTMEEIKEITGAPVFSAFPLVTSQKGKISVAQRK
jgi:uncharacterized protein involved in exopolysaccharide biosynthesis